MIKKRVCVPDWLYSARTTEEAVQLFENFFYQDIESYPDSLKGDENAWDMAKRVGYSYFHMLRDQCKSREAFEGAIVELGNKGFTWRYIEGSLNAQSNVFSFGAGTDISFEEQLIERYGCTVNLFDPTPQAVEFVVPRARKQPHLRFFPIGIYSRDAIVRFYKADEPGSGSLSTENLRKGKAFLDAPVRRLLSIMRSKDLSRLDYLKLDVEGAEYGVIDDLLFSGVIVKQMAIEFDQPVPPWRTERYIRKLHAAGYRLIDVWALNTLWVKAAQ